MKKLLSTAVLFVLLIGTVVAIIEIDAHNTSALKNDKAERYHAAR